MASDLFTLQLIYHNYSSKALLKILLLATAMAAIPCFVLVDQIDPINGCDTFWKFPLNQLPKLFKSKSHYPRSTTVETQNLASQSIDLDAAFHELVEEKWVTRGNRALSVGWDSSRAVMALKKLGFRSAIGIDGKACSSLWSLPFTDNSFDFVFSGALDDVTVPAKLVTEMERVLRPGRAGVLFRRLSGQSPATIMMKAAAPVASFLRISDIVGVQKVNSSAMVIFRKRVGIGIGKRGAGPRKALPLVIDSLQ